MKGVGIIALNSVFALVQCLLTIQGFEGV